jgi:hypothetical protein
VRRKCFSQFQQHASFARMPMLVLLLVFLQEELAGLAGRGGTIVMLAVV